MVLKEKIKIKLLNLKCLPVFKTEGAACADCRSAADAVIKLAPGGRTLVPLGFCIELPIGYEAVIRPRSSLSLQGIDVCIGTIDSDYRGGVQACIANNSGTEFTINPGDRICQLAIRKASPVSFVIVDELSVTARGTGGFGSTGRA